MSLLCEHDGCVTLPTSSCVEWPSSQTSTPVLLCSGKLLRGETFEVLWLFVKVFFTTFRAMVSFGGTSEESAKVSP